MKSVTRIVNQDNPLRFVGQLQGDNPFSNFINLKKAVDECRECLLKTYVSIDNVKETDPAGWRLVESEMDERLFGVPESMSKGLGAVFNLMGEVGLLGGGK